MRPNRNMRIGAFVVAVALLLIGLILVVRNFAARNATPTTVATTTDNGNTAPVETVALAQIAVARQDIPERSIVTRDMLEMRNASPGQDTGAFITDPGNQAVGFITSRRIARNAFLRQGDFVGHISEVGIAGALLPGTRAMIIPIANKSTLHELVRVGDRVDVLASFDQAEARTIVQDVRVLAVDVFGKDFPSVKVAMRGDYKASARAVGTANLPSQPAAGLATSPDAPEGSVAGPTVAPAAAATPAPTQGPAPARPEQALTIEVTPEQAAAIALTQAAGQNLDFLLRPHDEPGIPATVGGAEGDLRLAEGESAARPASITRVQLAPYSARLKNPAPAKNNDASSNGKRGNGERETSRPQRGSRGGGDVSYVGQPILPSPDNSGSRDVPMIPPANVEKMASPPTTYEIPVYGDGKLVRTDTVKKPRQ